MFYRPRRAARVHRLQVMVFVSSLAMMLSAAQANAGIRTYDADGQEIDYGCDLPHADNQGWFCYEAGPEGGHELPAELQPVRSAAMKASAAAVGGKGPKARASKAYSWHWSAYGYAHLGTTVVGRVWSTAGISFNGRQGIVNSHIQNENYGPPQRFELIVDAYRTDMSHADGVSAIKPTAPSFTTGGVDLTTWNPYFHGSSYFLSYNWYIRISGVNNPSSANGTWHEGPVHTPDFTCVDSTGNCYFP